MALIGYSLPDTLTDDAGNTLKGVTVTVTGPSSYSGTATSDATTGILRLGPLPVGEYVISLGSRSVTLPVIASDADVVTEAVAQSVAGVNLAPYATSAAVTSAVAAEATARTAADTAAATAASGTYALKAAGLSGLRNRRDLIPLGPRTLGSLLNNKSVTSHSSRVSFRLPIAARSITVAYENMGATDITVRASVEHTSGAVSLVYFDSGRDVVIKPGALVYGRAVDTDYTAGDTGYVRTFVTLASGTLACRQTTDFTGILPATDQWEDGGTDKTSTGTLTSSNGWLYTPAMIGTYLPGYSSVIAGGIGDSIMNGQGDAEGGGFTRSTAGVRPFVKVGIPGSGINGFYPETALGDRLSVFDGCTHVAAQMGTNDIINGSSLAAVQTAYLRLVRMLTDRGCKVYACTLTPRTSSTDSWATSGNQTPNGAGFTGGASSIRSQFNAWLRTLPPGVTGVIEVADALETARDSGLWKAGYTGDGTHPNGFNSGCRTAMKAAFDAVLTTWTTAP